MDDHCQNCGYETTRLIDVVGHPDWAPRTARACHSCARVMRERIVERRYPPPYLWVEVRDNVADDTLDAIVVDAHDDVEGDPLLLVFVYGEDGHSSFERIRVSEDLLPQAQRPRYTIWYRYGTEVEKWLKEIEES